MSQTPPQVPYSLLPAKDDPEMVAQIAIPGTGWREAVVVRRTKRTLTAQMDGIRPIQFNVDACLSPDRNYMVRGYSYWVTPASRAYMFRITKRES